MQSSPFFLSRLTRFPLSQVLSATLDTSTVPVNVLETNDAFEVHAYVPGLPRDAMSTKVEDGVLSIVVNGSDGADTDKERRVWALREVEPARGERQFNLPPTVDAQRISARLANGVLIVSVPKKSVNATSIAIEE